MKVLLGGRIWVLCVWNSQIICNTAPVGLLEMLSSYSFHNCKGSWSVPVWLVGVKWCAKAAPLGWKVQLKLMVQRSWKFPNSRSACGFHQTSFHRSVTTGRCYFFPKQNHWMILFLCFYWVEEQKLLFLPPCTERMLLWLHSKKPQPTNKPCTKTSHTSKTPFPSGSSRSWIDL